MSSVTLQELVRAAVRLQDSWLAAGFEFCFIGGLAVQHWGEPRQTGDVDATLWTDFGRERPVIDRLLLDLSPRIADAAQFAMLNRVLLVQEPGGVDTDISLAAFPFERDVIDRAELVIVHCQNLHLFVRASDLVVVLKAFANRPRDWQDIRGVIVRSGVKLDWPRLMPSLRCSAI
ncbi:MAG: DUF6036 family nucleotidyltransferase [Pirellulales bacterium]